MDILTNSIDKWSLERTQRTKLFNLPISLMSMAPSFMSRIKVPTNSPSPAEVLGNHGMQEKDQ
jgi:hypothetical protein